VPTRSIAANQASIQFHDIVFNLDRNLNEARQLYEVGASLVQVGRHFHVDAETVRRR
jgi:urease beta subunit